MERPSFSFQAESKLLKSDVLLSLYLLSLWKPFARQMQVVAKKCNKKEAYR